MLSRELRGRAVARPSRLVAVARPYRTAADARPGNRPAPPLLLLNDADWLLTLLLLRLDRLLWLLALDPLD